MSKLNFFTANMLSNVANFIPFNAGQMVLMMEEKAAVVVDRVGEAEEEVDRAEPSLDPSNEIYIQQTTVAVNQMRIL